MRIIIYGLGQKGWEFISDIREVLKNIEIVAMTDTNIQKIEKQDADGIPYIGPWQIQEYIYDYIVITPEKYFDEIKSKLCLWGIEVDKIKTVREIEEKEIDTYCELCGSNPGVWKYIGENYDIFRKKDIMGASKRRGGCAVCGSSDRERYVYHIIKNFTGILDGEKHSVLHFAPEYMLSGKIRAVCGETYITADIEPGRGDVTANITCLQFANNQFEYIICNHVMEHVIEEEKAFSELRRCLDISGVLVLTVPICWSEKTFENKQIVTKEGRVEYYGQEDHVRLYGNDIVERIEGFGFKVRSFLCNEIIGVNERKKLGFVPGDAVFLCRKV